MHVTQSVTKLLMIKELKFKKVILKHIFQCYRIDIDQDHIVE